MKKTMTTQFLIKEVDDTGVFSGYGSVFDNVDGGRDMVIKGAFKNTLETHDKNKTMPLMLYSHNQTKESGEWLEMYEDAHGLFCKGKLWIDGPNPDPDALKAYRGMKKQKVKMGLSIGYMIPEGGAEFIKDEGYWKLKEIDLYEVSPTPMPMNPKATVESVKAAESIITVRDFEEFLRDSGFTKEAAVNIASNGFNRRDSGGFDRIAAEKTITNTVKIFRSKTHAR